MEVKWLEYQGKRILYVDYRGAKDENDMISVLHQEVEILKQQQEKTLTLSNFEGTYATDKFMGEVKKLGKEVGIVKMGKSANTGITGIKKVLFKAYIAFTGQRDNRIFEDEDKAKAWLLS